MTTINVNNPFDGSLIKTISQQSAADVEQAIESGFSLFNDPNQWLPALSLIHI